MPEKKIEITIKPGDSIQKIRRDFPWMTLELLEQALKDWKESCWRAGTFSRYAYWMGLCPYFYRVHGKSTPEISRWLKRLGMVWQHPNPTPWMAERNLAQPRVEFLEQVITLYKNGEE